MVLGEALPSINFAACFIAFGTIGLIALIKRVRPHWPVLLIAVVVATFVTWLFNLPIETIGSRFGGVPSHLPAPAMPAFDLARLGSLLPDAIAIALLGSIESLLSAVVADSMTGRRHRSNTELMAQGIANIGSALFGGITATGTIARTATNVRAGAHGPVAGMLHALYLLGFMLLLAPLMAKIPLAALAGLLAIVAWNMAEKHAVLNMLRGHGADAAVLMATFLITIFRDLTEGILVGVLLGSILFAVRMAELVEVSSGSSFTDQTAETPLGNGDDRIITYRISGPLFFGSTPRFGDVMSRIGIRPRFYILDLAAVPLVDASGAEAISGFARQAGAHGADVIIAAARSDIAEALRRDSSSAPNLIFSPSVAEARQYARSMPD
jgi:SulP family sulfate permease